jgi:Holliday junction resolvase-like predicted endonuclease
MPTQPLVRKAAGEIEPFSEYKLIHYLNQAGVSKNNEQNILQQIKTNLTADPFPTSEIHKLTYQYLTQTDPAAAARYNLRQAVMELGPTGYPFEQYVAQLLNHQGFITKTNQIIKGECTSHEVDIIASKANTRYMIECKYHNLRGSRSDIKTALYVWARFEDISQAWKTNKQVEEKFHQAWLVTNTKVSTDAEDYAKCRGLNIISWYRPYHHSLKDMIVNTGLWPITCLTTLVDEDKQKLVKQNLFLCKDIIKLNNKELKKLKIANSDIAVKEAQFICQVPQVETTPTHT